MKKINNILFVFCLFILLIGNCLSVNVVSSEVECITNLAINTGGFNPVNISSNFCSLVFNTCDKDGYITIIFFNQQSSTYELKYEDFVCFSKLTKIQASNTMITETFFTKLPPLVDTLFITSNNLTSISVVFPKLYTLSIYGQYKQLKVSQLQNLNTFSTSKVELVYDKLMNMSLYELDISCDNIPILSYFPNLKKLNIGIEPKTFNYSSYEKVLTFSSLQTISFNVNEFVTIPFPSQIDSIVNPQWSSLSFYGSFYPPTKKLDFSKNNVTGTKIYCTGCGPLFNVSGEFPFALLPPSISTLDVSGGRYSVFPDIGTICKNVTYYCSIANGDLSSLTLPKSPLKNYLNINLSGNNLKGTLDESWCQTSVQVQSNKLTGKIPDCFYCHINNNWNLNNRFDQNLFSNFNTTSAFCDYTQMIVNIDISKKPNIVLYGKNIGYQSSNIVTYPDSSIIAFNFNNGNFTGLLSSVGSSLKNITISFKTQPYLKWIVSVSNTPPQIDSITQDNSTLTILGSFFNYDMNQIKLEIEEDLKCKIINSTFSQIICTLDYPILPYGNKSLSVTVNNLTGSKSFNLQYTQYPCPIPDCNNNGLCNDHIGECQCFQQWTTVGDDICIITNHYISTSTQVDSSTGGLVQLYGYFGSVYNNIYLSIDGTRYQVSSTSKDIFEITIGPGSVGEKQIDLLMNGLEFGGKIYPYFGTSPKVQCFNNCSSYGSCNTTNGECRCNTGRYGIDCSGISPNTPTTLLNTDEIPAILSNEQIGYSISVTGINEINSDGEIDNSLLFNTWETVDQGKYVTKSNNIQIVMITFNAINNMNVIFNNNQFFIQKGITANINVLNWNYTRNENTLQVLLSSSIENIQGVTPNNCNSKDIVYQGGSMSKTTNDINYFKVSTQAKTLYARIQNKVSIFDILTPITTTLISNNTNGVTIGINIPHSPQSTIVTDFSLYLTPNFKTSESCTSSSSSTLSSENNSDDSVSKALSTFIFSSYIISLSLLSVLLF